MKERFNFHFEINELGQLEKLLKVTDYQGKVIQQNFEPNLIKILKTRINHFSYDPKSVSSNHVYDKIEEFVILDNNFPIMVLTYDFASYIWP